MPPLLGKPLDCGERGVLCNPRYGWRVDSVLPLAERDAFRVAGRLEILLRQDVGKGIPLALPKERSTVANEGRTEYNDRGSPLSLRLRGGVWNKGGPWRGFR